MLPIGCFPLPIPKRSSSGSPSSTPFSSGTNPSLTRFPGFHALQPRKIRIWIERDPVFAPVRLVHSVLGLLHKQAIDPDAVQPFPFQLRLDRLQLLFPPGGKRFRYRCFARPPLER